MEFLKTFSELNKTNAPIAGGKGASLGEMTNAGIPVPPGFVVLSASFEKFLEETDLNIEIDSILETVKHEDINTVEQASEKIQALILAAKMPDDIASLIQKYFQELGTEFVAVRSSATAEDSASAAWAGQLDSFLNTTEKDLLEKVKRCWASLFTPRAIFYRFEQNLHTQKISVAVVVQKMVVSEVSGIAFSVHPVTQDYNQLIIEAGFGLGEAIVSGQITPDSYVVEKEPRRIIDKNIAEQTRGIFRAVGGGDEWLDIPSTRGNEKKINDEQILELSEIILGIENHYGFPCDIEWAYENGKFYIVQSRPITTLMKKEDEIKSTTQPHENAEELPEFFHHLTRFATRPMTAQRDEMAFGLWRSFSPSRYVSIPLGEGNRACFVENSDMENGFKKLINLEFSTSETWHKHLRLYEEFVEHCHQTSEQAAAVTETSSLKECLEIYQAWLKIVANYSVIILAPFAIERFLDPECRGLLAEEFGEEADKIFGIISTPDVLNEFQNMRLDIIESVLNNKPTPEELVEKYFWFSEYSFVEPLLDVEHFIQEKSKLNLIAAREEQEKLLVETKKNHQDFLDLLEKIKNPQAKLLAEIIHTYVYLRTDRLDHWKMVQAPLRKVFQRIAKELSSLTQQIWTLEMVAYCLNSELIDFLSQNKIPDREAVEKRRGQQYVYYFADDVPQILYGEEIVNQVKEVIEPKEMENNLIKGTIAFKGKVKGLAVLVNSKKDLSKIKEGDVLVAKITLPDYTPFMRLAVAFVTEEGGVTSHAAIIARELQKPCIVGTGNCMRLIKDGDLIEVDADNGIVKIIK